MATLTVLEFPEEPTALDISASEVSAAAGGDVFPNDEQTGFWVDNQDASPTTVTFDAPGYCDDGFQHDAAVVVAAGFTGFIAKKFAHGRFGTSSRQVAVTYSSVTSLTVAAVRL